MSNLGELYSLKPALVYISASDPTSTVDVNGKLIYSTTSSALFIFESTSGPYGSGSWTKITSGGGGGTPGGLTNQLQFNNNGVFGGLGNSVVDGVSGGVVLGGAFTVNATATGESISLVSDDNAGTGVVQIVGGDQIAMNVGGISGIQIDATNDGQGNPGTGPIDLLTDSNLTINGLAGISGTGTTISNITVTNGIITAATFV